MLNIKEKCNEIYLRRKRVDQNYDKKLIELFNVFALLCDSLF